MHIGRVLYVDRAQAAAITEAAICDGMIIN
jgi:hypothetical protein